MLIGPVPARADTTVSVTTIVDTTTSGDGACSLREAVLFANGTSEPDCSPVPASGTTMITLPSGLYALTGGALSLTRDAAINGAGASSTTINAGGNSQVITVSSAAHVSIGGVTVTGGRTGFAPCSGLVCTLIVRFGGPGAGIDNSGTLSLNGVTVSGNHTGTGGPNPFCVSGCSVGDGGPGAGVENTGTMTINNSTVSDNVTGAGGSPSAGANGANPGDTGQQGGSGGSGGNGAGIDNSGALTVTGSTISGNVTGAGTDGARGGDGNTNGDGGRAGTPGNGGAGGGIENTGTLTVIGSTFVGNRTGPGGNGGTGGNGNGTGRGGDASSGGAGGAGGAIDGSTGATVSNATFLSNATAAGGAAGSPGTGVGGALGGHGLGGNGAAVHQTAMGATVTHVTVANNTAAGTGGGLSGDGGSITVSNSIVAGNSGTAGAMNCGGAVSNQGSNVALGDNSCAGFLVADPKLASLADNGGPTQTIALQPGSAAIHHVPTCVASTDQRGVARPVGSACDSGAYEVAAPTISAARAAADGTTSATVTASINPNFKAASVTVQYGTTTALGSSLPAQNLAAVNAPVPFSGSVTGLRPSTTYHARIVAANADGTSTSADIVFATPAPLATAIGGASTNGTVLALTIDCAHGSPGNICSGPITLSTHETTQGGAPVAVASTVGHATRGKPSRGHKPKRKTLKLTVAKGRFSVASGKKKTIKLTLNKAGQALLTHFYRLPTTLSIRGTSSLSKTVTFRYRRLHLSPAYQWAFSKTFAFATQLTVSGLPRASHVALVCHGGGCPFAKKSFAAPKHGKLQLAPALKQRHLSVGSTVDLEITAANTVGEVVRFTVLSGKLPKESFLCMPPGTRAPAACTA